MFPQLQFQCRWSEGVISTTTADVIEFEQEKEVLVFLGNQDGTRQPDTFQFCPLGVQLYTDNPIEECRLIDLQLSLPAVDGVGEETVACTGLVAQCLPSQNGKNLFRVWIKFLDLEPETSERIRVLTTDRKFICPFCCNF